MEMTRNAVSWFEIPTADFGRAKAFYSTIFDFEMPEMPMGPTRLGILLHESDGGIGGAIIEDPNQSPGASGARVYLSGGTDLAVVLARVESAGGVVVVSKTEIAPGMGHFALFRDTEGNVLGLHSMS